MWRKALYASVVIAMSSTAETLDKTICNKLFAEGIACVLAATVAGKDVPSSQPYFSRSVYTELFLHVIIHFKSDYFVVEAVKDRRYIEL